MRKPGSEVVQSLVRAAILSPHCAVINYDSSYLPSLSSVLVNQYLITFLILVSRHGKVRPDGVDSGGGDGDDGGGPAN